VAVLGSASDCYLIMAQTKDGHMFWLVHTGTGPADTFCSPPGPNGCRVDASIRDPLVGSW